MRLSLFCVLVFVHVVAGAAAFDPDAIQALISNGDAKTAVAQMEAILDQRPDDPNARYWLARAELAQIGDSVAMGKLVKARSAKKNLERVLEIDPNHLAARESLARYLIEAPGIAGGSLRKARVQADKLRDLNKAAGYRVDAAIARYEKDYGAAVDLQREALRAAGWDWSTQYALIVEAVHHQTANAEEALDEAMHNVRRHAEDPQEFLPLIDYQRGKLAAVSGRALQKGRDALQRYLQHDPVDDAPDLVWAEFRLAQVERQMSRTDAAEARLSRLESEAVPEDLTFALRDERRWHYSD